MTSENISEDRRLKDCHEEIMNCLERHGCVMCIDTVTADKPRMYLILEDELNNAPVSTEIH